MLIIRIFLRLLYNKKEALIELLKRKNKKLEEENKKLREQLKIAYAEVYKKF